MTQIFLSYAREDVEFAAKMFRNLKELGLDVWFDRETLLPGQNWRIEIQKGIRRARFFLCLLSSTSTTKRGFVNKEIKEALDVLDEYPAGEVYMIPIRLDNCIISDPRLSNLHYIDLFPDWESGLKKVLLSLGVSEVTVGSEASGILRLPKDRNFVVSSAWSSEGMEIRGGSVTISAGEAMKLIRVLVDWVPDFISKNRTAEEAESVTRGKAIVTGVIRAFYEVYNYVPDEAEMEKGSSIFSRKMNLFFGYMEQFYSKAHEIGVDPRDYFFREGSLDDIVEGGANEVEDPDVTRHFLRLMLQAYVWRTCDIKLDEVEKVESTIREIGAPSYDGLVESVYNISEDKIVGLFNNIKSRDPGLNSEEIAQLIIGGAIEAAIVEDIPRER